MPVFPNNLYQSFWFDSGGSSHPLDTQGVLGMKLHMWHTGIDRHGCKVCDDNVRALVDIDARYAVISMADELP
ncbi:hypothetical protein A2U01_0067735, partial [Trifolium medium]|nr:hypothetical protein [Trifolium medium]